MDRHEVETHLVGDFDDISLHELANREFPMSTAVLFVTTDARVVPPGLVKVAKSDGKIVSSVQLGDKTPEYEVEEIEGMLYFKKSDGVIEAYAM